MFHNTVQATGETLDKYRTDAKKQQDRVLAIMKANPVWWTPQAVHEFYQRLYGPALLTSIRRSLTDLTPEHLEKSQTANAPGKYGVKTHQWRIAMKQEQGTQLNIF